MTDGQVFKKMEIPLGNVVQNIRALADGVESGEFEVVGMVAQENGVMDHNYRGHAWRIVIRGEKNQFEVNCSNTRENTLGNLRTSLKNAGSVDDACEAMAKGPV